MIVSKLSGGLGNQMFQYALGLHLSVLSGLPLKLDPGRQDRPGQRLYGLDGFNIRGTRVVPEHRHSRKARLSGFMNRDSSGKMQPDASVKHVNERSFAFDPGILLLREPVQLSGYWQSEKYFTNIADDVRHDFSLAAPMSEYRQGVLDEIRNCKSVSLHVRRGDYVTNQKTNAYHGTCEPDWYAQAIDNIVQRLGSVTFFVFSDDPQWVRAHIRPDQKTVFVDPQSDGKDAEDMHLMAACNAHIIANSTFSWWGAWLNPDPEKNVIAPARWFREVSLDTADLIPRKWHRL